MPYYRAKVPYYRAKEPYYRAKEPYDRAKVPYYMAKEPTDRAKETLLQDHNLVIQRRDFPPGCFRIHRYKKFKIYVLTIILMIVNNYHYKNTLIIVNIQ